MKLFQGRPGIERGRPFLHRYKIPLLMCANDARPATGLRAITAKVLLCA